jgi:hypothetical protein
MTVLTGLTAASARRHRSASPPCMAPMLAEIGSRSAAFGELLEANAVKLHGPPICLVKELARVVPCCGGAHGLGVGVDDSIAAVLPGGLGDAVVIGPVVEELEQLVQSHSGPGWVQLEAPGSTGPKRKRSTVSGNHRSHRKSRVCLVRQLSIAVAAFKHSALANAPRPA